MADGPVSDRETRELLAGGIVPGHPSLYRIADETDDT